MKMWLRRVIWSAVACAVAAIASLVSAVVGSETLSVSFGLVAVAAAILSNRERG